MKVEGFYEERAIMNHENEPKTEISKICRREYDGGDINPVVQLDFIREAITRAHQQLSEITNLGLMDAVYFHVVAGAKMKGYDELQDIERTPPFYMWCRVSVDVDSSSIKNWGLCISVGRKPGGMLPTEFI